MLFLSALYENKNLDKNRFVCLFASVCLTMCICVHFDYYLPNKQGFCLQSLQMIIHIGFLAKRKALIKRDGW